MYTAINQITHNTGISNYTVTTLYTSIKIKIKRTVVEVWWCLAYCVYAYHIEQHAIVILKVHTILKPLIVLTSAQRMHHMHFFEKCIEICTLLKAVYFTLLHHYQKRWPVTGWKHRRWLRTESRSLIVCVLLMFSGGGINSKHRQYWVLIGWCSHGLYGYAACLVFRRQ